MEHSVNGSASIRSCKICGDNCIKIPRPKTASGYVGAVDDEGKHWHGLICSKCLPEVRKTKYRPHKPKVEICCKGCGNTFQTNKPNKSETCSKKCYMRVSRKNTTATTHRDKGLHKILLPGTEE